MSFDALLAPVREWLVEQALGNGDIVKLFETTCLRLNSVGIPITRARLFWPTLHPLFTGETVLWEQGAEARLEQFEHRDNLSDQWMKSPLKFMVDHKVDTFRRRLSGPDANADFELLEDLQKEGFTDYLLLGTTLGGTAFRVHEDGNSRGVLATFATKAEKGFTEDHILALQKTQRRLAVACKSGIQSRITDNIATTYLGERAGKYVLEGQIRRGDGKRTRAVVWYSDMRNSTRLAETMEPEAYFDMLNAFFSATAAPVVQHGGEILDFIGDAVLAIFPFESDEELKNAALAANHAVADANSISVSVNRLREAEGLQRFGYGIALNKGEVMFGNIGIPSRLSFSVISPTVNEAARIENKTKELGHSVLADASFARLIPEFWESLGQHQLDGVGHKTELFSWKNGQTG